MAMAGAILRKNLVIMLLGNSSGSEKEVRCQNLSSSGLYLAEQARRSASSSIFAGRACRVARRGEGCTRGVPPTEYTLLLKNLIKIIEMPARTARCQLSTVASTVQYCTWNYWSTVPVHFIGRKLQYYGYAWI
jgi:hypothetical protein